MSSLVRGQYIHFRLSSEEKLILERMANYERRGISELMRELVREGAQKRGFEFISQEKEEKYENK